MTNCSTVSVVVEEKSDKIIFLLSIIADEISTQYEAAKKLDMQANKILQDTTGRMHGGDKAHLQHMKDRQAYFSDIQEKLANSLQLNQQLASKYRETKYSMYYTKIKLFLKIEKSLDIYTKVIDKRQMHTLQTRMHSLLQDYFNIRSRFNWFLSASLIYRPICLRIFTLFS
jgi:hypothetical protein